MSFNDLNNLDLHRLILANNFINPSLLQPGFLQQLQALVQNQQLENGVHPPVLPAQPLFGYQQNRMIDSMNHQGIYQQPALTINNGGGHQLFLQKQLPLLDTPPPSRRHTAASPIVVSGKRLHVTNLPFSVKSLELHEKFSPFGRVVHAEIITNDRGSKGFGFVTMSTEAEATQAKEQMDGRMIHSRRIIVNYATVRRNELRQRANASPFERPSPTYAAPLMLAPLYLQLLAAAQGNAMPIMFPGPSNLSLVRPSQFSHSVPSISAPPVIYSVTPSPLPSPNHSEDKSDGLSDSRHGPFQRS